MGTKTVYLSTSKLAGKHNKPAREMFSILMEENLVDRLEETWKLTSKGERFGGVIKTHFRISESILLGMLSRLKIILIEM